MSVTPSSLPPRHPGAQPGNQNAFKHGFYTRKVKKTDLDALDKTEFIGLSEEIRCLRLYIRRAVEAFQSGESGLDLLTFGRLLCMSLNTLNRLVMTHHRLAQNQDPVMQLLNQTLDDLVAEGFIRTDDTDDNQGGGAAVPGDDPCFSEPGPAPTSECQPTPSPSSLPSSPNRSSFVPAQQPPACSSPPSFPGKGAGGLGLGAACPAPPSFPDTAGDFRQKLEKSCSRIARKDRMDWVFHNPSNPLTSLLSGAMSTPRAVMRVIREIRSPAICAGVIRCRQSVASFSPAVSYLFLLRSRETTPPALFPPPPPVYGRTPTPIVPHSWTGDRKALLFYHLSALKPWEGRGSRAG